MSRVREHQARQNADRLAAGTARQEDGRVFATLLGDSVRPGVFSSWNDRLVKGASIPRILLLNMRHTAAPLMNRRGLPPNTVIEHWATPTRRTHTHLEDHQREAAAFDLGNPPPAEADAPN
jgi:hypothetical protein